MVMSEREEVGDEKTSKPSSSNWEARLKDARIVRVSRATGGKDRHSKVCTVKGLRDRRVRLSVPTAIQLYDLQDRLGLNQPSKVVDWLLSAAKHEIDELPPLQLPGNFVYNPDIESDKSHAAHEEREFWKGRESNDHDQFVMRWDGSSLSLAQSDHEFRNNNYNNVVFPLQGTQLAYQPNNPHVMNQSCFPMNMVAPPPPTATSEYVIPGQIDFHMLNPTSPSGLPFHLSTQGPAGKNS